MREGYESIEKNKKPLDTKFKICYNVDTIKKGNKTMSKHININHKAIDEEEFKVMLYIQNFVSATSKEEAKNLFIEWLKNMKDEDFFKEIEVRYC